MTDRMNTFFDWGNNCRLQGFSSKQADETLREFFGGDSADLENKITSEEYDQFFVGYFYGTSKEIVPISLTES